MNISISTLIPEALRTKIIDNARAREAIHKNHASSRPLSKNYEVIGLMGECAVANYLGLQVDWELRPAGDRGKDFDYRGWTVDVKTARKPYNLLREANKPHGDILILAGIDEELTTITLIGWEYDSLLIQQPKKFFGYNICNHFIHASKLRDMATLKDIHEKP